jgi:hypothetical protein
MGSFLIATPPENHLSDLTVQMNGPTDFSHIFKAYEALRLCLQQRRNPLACALLACPVMLSVSLIASGRV